MSFEFGDFLTALGLAMVLEGSLYALFPDHVRRMMVQIMSLPGNQLRMMGLTIAILGALTVWMVRG